MNFLSENCCRGRGSAPNGVGSWSKAVEFEIQDLYNASMCWCFLSVRALSFGVVSNGVC